MNFTLLVCGYGFALRFRDYDINTASTIFFDVAILKKHRRWKWESLYMSPAGFSSVSWERGKDFEKVEGWTISAPLTNHYLKT